MEGGDFYNDFIEMNLPLLLEGVSKINDGIKGSDYEIKFPANDSEDINKNIFKFVITNMNLEDLRKYYINYHNFLLV